MIRPLLAMLFLGAAALTASAQHQGHGGHHPLGRSAAAPYAGFQDRPIKALSQQQIDDLQAGRGMGLALAAELNGYPGLCMFWSTSRRLASRPGKEAGWRI